MKNSKDKVVNQKLIQTLDRGGLTAVNIAFERIFLRTEEYFRKCTQEKSHLSTINISDMVNNLLQNTEVISHYKSVVDTCGVVSPDDEDCAALLIDMLSLYLQVRSFSLARGVVSKHKMDSKRKRSKGLRNEIKKATDKPHVTECECKSVKYDKVTLDNLQ